MAVHIAQQPAKTNNTETSFCLVAFSVWALQRNYTVTIYERRSSGKAAWLRFTQMYLFCLDQSSMENGEGQFFIFLLTSSLLPYLVRKWSKLIAAIKSKTPDFLHIWFGRHVRRSTWIRASQPLSFVRLIGNKVPILFSQSFFFYYAPDLLTRLKKEIRGWKKKINKAARSIIV